MGRSVPEIPPALKGIEHRQPIFQSAFDQPFGKRQKQDTPKRHPAVCNRNVGASPHFAGVFIGRESAERLQPAREVVG